MKVQHVEPDLMTVGEASRALDINKTIIRKFMKNHLDSTPGKPVGEHRLPYVEVGVKKTKMVRRADFESFFESFKEGYQFGQCRRGAGPTRESLKRYQEASKAV